MSKIALLAALIAIATMSAQAQSTETIDAAKAACDLVQNPEATKLPTPIPANPPNPRAGSSIRFPAQPPPPYLPGHENCLNIIAAWRAAHGR